MEEELRQNQGQDEEQEQHSQGENESALPEGRADGRRGEAARKTYRAMRENSRNPTSAIVPPAHVTRTFSADWVSRILTIVNRAKCY
jgi:hypothetical protein